MNLPKIRSDLTIEIYDVVDEKSVIQARADITRIRAELRRIEAEKLRITKPARELVSSFNAEVKKITDGLKKVLDSLLENGERYIAKQREIESRAKQIEGVEKTGDVISDAFALLGSIQQATIAELPVTTRKIKELKYNDKELKIWLAKNRPEYLEINVSGVMRNIALLEGVPASIEIKEGL